MPEDGHARELRDYLLEQLQSLGNQLRAKKGCARHIPARPRQAGYLSLSQTLSRLAVDRESDDDRAQ